MTDSRISSRESLIDRIEKATRPDKELGREILLACGWRKTCVGHFYGPLYHWSGPAAPESYDEDRMPCPTASIDMAMKLVPSGWTVACLNQNDDKTWACELREGFLTSYSRVVFGPDKQKAPNGAIAICSAALKARAEGSVQ